MSIILVAFETALPVTADRMFTLVVAAILIGLGLRSLWRVPHQHSGRKVRSPLQALFVGMIHGLAGSSALTAMVFATLPNASSRLLFIVVFGVGSIVGMAVVSGAAGAWLQRLERPWLMTALRVVIGTASIAIGVMTAVDAIQT
jgi:predicted membrane-bound spermidine synthase